MNRVVFGLSSQCAKEALCYDLTVLRRQGRCSQSREILTARMHKYAKSTRDETGGTLQMLQPTRTSVNDPSGR